MPTRGGVASRSVRADVPFVVLAATALVTVGFGAIFALLPDYQAELGFAAWGLGAVTSASFVAGFCAQLGLARYADRGWGRLMLAGGLGLAAAGCAAIAAAPNLAVLVAARVVLGLGEGIFLPAARRVVITRNPNAVGAGLGTMTATATGAFLAGPPFAAFVAGWTSLRVPFFLLSGALVLAVPAVARFDVPRHPHEPAPGALRRLARTRGVRRGIYLGLGLAVAIGVYDSLWARFLKDLGASTRFVALSLTIFAAPIALLAPRAGRLADRYGPQRVGVIGTLGAVPFIVAYGFVASYWAIAVFALFHSVFDSATNPSAQAQVARATPPPLVAAGQGLLDGTALMGAALSAAVAAPVYDRWGAQVLWVGLAAAVTACGLVAARPAPRSQAAAGPARAQPVG